jgi:hypothetical protein
MSEQLKESRAGGNGTASSEKRKRSSHARAIPGINLQELVAERNWSALAGLGLIAFGLLYLVQDFFGIHFNLWSVGLIGIGGFLMIDAWQTYQENDHTWAGAARNRMTGGAVIALIGLIAALNLSGWTLLLLAIAGALGFDSWQKYQDSGRVWTGKARKRMVAAVVVGLIGLASLIHWWSTWPLLLIILGAAMFFGHIGGKR